MIRKLRPFFLLIALAAALYACSQAAQNAAGAPSAAAAASPAAAPSPESEESLCRLPDLPPAELRAKPGYTQLQVLATNAAGAPLTGLKQSDFAIRSGSQTLPIVYFHEQTSAHTPVSIVLVLDASASMYNKIVLRHGDMARSEATLNAATEKFNNCDEAALVMIGGEYNPNSLAANQYSGLAPGSGYPPNVPTALSMAAAQSGSSLQAPGEATLAQPFTTVAALIKERISQVAPSGEKKLANGIGAGLSTLADAHYPNRAMIIVTDGLDASQVEESARMLEQLRSSGTRLWVIGVGDPNASVSKFPRLFGDDRVDAAAIKRLAAAGGGQAVFVKPIDDDDGASIAEAIEEVANHVGHGYALGVIAPPDSQSPTAELAPEAAARGVLRAGVVSAQLLAEAAARLQPRRCIAARETRLPEIASKPGYTQLAVAVTDSNGKPVQGLKESDFSVDSDSTSLPVKYFAEESHDGAESVVIAIDTSGSMQLKLDTVKSQFARLIKSLSPTDEVALVGFSSQPDVLRGFTTARRELVDDLALLHAYGQTAIYDTLDNNLKMLSRAKFARRAIVLVTDGMDNSSKTTKENLLATLRNQGVPIYTIGIGDPNAPSQPGISIGPIAIANGGDADRVDEITLDQIARASGGQDFIVPPMNKDGGKGFYEAVTNISDRLGGGGYEVGVIMPLESDPPTVTVPGRPDLVVEISCAAATPSTPDASSAAQ